MIAQADPAAGRFIFHVFGAVAQFERDLVSERTKFSSEIEMAFAYPVDEKRVSPVEISVSSVVAPPAPTVPRHVSADQVAHALNLGNQDVGMVVVLKTVGDARVVLRPKGRGFTQERVDHRVPRTIVFWMGQRAEEELVVTKLSVPHVPPNVIVEYGPTQFVVAAVAEVEVPR